MPDADCEKRAPASIAFKIIARRGVALRRPALGAPVLDVARLAHQCLEPLRLAKRRMGGVPDITHLATNNAGVHSAFQIVQDAVQNRLRRALEKQVVDSSITNDAPRFNTWKAQYGAL